VQKLRQSDLYRPKDLYIVLVAISVDESCKMQSYAVCASYTGLVKWAKMRYCNKKNIANASVCLQKNMKTHLTVDS